MIDKFNFYDIYGYFLPGAVLLLLFWLPLGLVKNKWPTGDWTSAVIAVVLAYVAGHLLQMFAGKIIPSSVAKGGTGNNRYDRYPSERLLDPYKPENNWTQLSKTVKESLPPAIKDKLKIEVDLGLQLDPSTKEIDLARRDAFFLARHYLVFVKDAAYAEQFESMYSLTRGMAAASALATVYYVGWALTGLGTRWPLFAAIIAMAVGLLLAINSSAFLLLQKRSRTAEWLSTIGLLLTVWGVGYGLGQRYQVSAQKGVALILCSAAALLACLRSYRAYRGFIEEFAITVWRDFLVVTEKEQQATGSSAAGGSKPAEKA